MYEKNTYVTRAIFQKIDNKIIIETTMQESFSTLLLMLIFSTLFIILFGSNKKIQATYYYHNGFNRWNAVSVLLNNRIKNEPSEIFEPAIKLNEIIIIALM